MADRRKEQGLSQAELAKLSGITRQAVYAIEANQYLAQYQISLQLANVLNCTVEDLFSLQGRDEVVEAELIAKVDTQKKPMRVKLSQVGTRMLARPMAELGDVLNFVMPLMVYSWILSGRTPKKATVSSGQTSPFAGSH